MKPAHRSPLWRRVAGTLLALLVALQPALAALEGTPGAEACGDGCCCAVVEAAGASATPSCCSAELPAQRERPAPTDDCGCRLVPHAPEGGADLALLLGGGGDAGDRLELGARTSARCVVVSAPGEWPVHTPVAEVRAGPRAPGHLGRRLAERGVDALLASLGLLRR